MTRYVPRVALLNSFGNHVRYVPAALAEAMVSHGAAAPVSRAGRVREISLVCSAATHAHRIGEPTAEARGVRFYRWVHLEESGTRIIEHHPRCLYEDDDE